MFSWKWCALDLELWNPLKKCVTLLCNISVNWCFNKCALDPSRCKCPLNISSEDLPPTGYPFSMNFWKLWEQPRESSTKWPDTVLSLVCFSRNSRSPSHSSTYWDYCHLQNHTWPEKLSFFVILSEPFIELSCVTLLAFLDEETVWIGYIAHTDRPCSRSQCSVWTLVCVTHIVSS